MPPDATASWMDAFPSVTDHPASAPAASPVAAPAPASPTAASGAAPSWMDALPGVTNHPAAQPDPPPPAPVNHPTAGPTDPASPWPSLSDIGRNIYSGAVNAATGIAHRAAELGADSPTVSPAGIAPPTGTAPSMPQMKDAAYNKLGVPEYVPQTAAGRVGQTVAGAASLLPLGGASSLPEMASQIPGTLGGAAGAGIAQEVAPNSPIAPLIGAVLGAKGTSAATNATTALTGVRTAAGGSLPLEDAQLAQRAQDMDIPLTVAQVSRSPAVKYAASATSKLPFSGNDAFADEQRGAWIKAVTNQFGEDSTKVTPEVLQAAKDRLGDGFNTIAARTTIPMSNDFMNDMQGVVSNAKLSMPTTSADVVEKGAMNVLDTAANNNGNLGGRAYLTMTAKGGPLDQMMSSGDSGIRYGGQQLRNVIDDHFQQAASPGDSAELGNLRGQWKAMKTVEPLTLRADTVGGATPSTGDISPVALRAAVNKSYKNAALAPLGQIPLNDLAKIGQRFLKEPPSSGTAERTGVQEAVHGAGNLLGALTMGAAAHEAGLPIAASVGVPLATMLAGRAVNGSLRNQLLARQSVAASLNPNGFRFGAPTALPALPSIWSGGGSNSTPAPP